MNDLNWHAGTVQKIILTKKDMIVLKVVHLMRKIKQTCVTSNQI